MRFDSFSQLLQVQAERYPDAPALRYNGRELTYAALREAVLDRAEALQMSIRK